MGIMPIHGLQVITLLFFASVFKLNRPLAFLGVNISFAPLLPFILGISYYLGSMILHQPLCDNSSLSTTEMISQFTKEVIVGGLVLAPSMAVITFLISYPLFRKMKLHIQK